MGCLIKSRSTTYKSLCNISALASLRDHGGTFGAFLPRLGHFPPKASHELPRKGWPPLPTEGALTESDVSEVADKAESPERSKYEPVHHNTSLQRVLAPPTYSFNRPLFLSRFRLSPTFPIGCK